MTKLLGLPYWTAILCLSLSIPAAAQAQSPLHGPDKEVLTQNLKSKITKQDVQAALPKLAKLAQTHLQKSGVPGMAIAVVHQDQVVYLQGFGRRQIGKSEPVDPDTVFQLASLSKPIATTIIASVVGEGWVNWDDPVNKYVPSFQMQSPYVTQEVTLRDLLSHRSGLPEHAGDDLEDLGFDRAIVLNRLRYFPTENNFRAQYAYTNFGFTAAAVAAAAAVSKPWEVLAAEKLYQPLGMINTSSRFVDFQTAQNRAAGHVLINGKWVNKYQRQPDAQSPAGGVSSTVRDLAQWLRLQLGNGTVDGRQIISANALAETHRPQMISESPVNAATDRASLYGLGWNVGYSDEGLVRLNHSGAFNLGAATTVYLLPQEELGIVILTNASPIGLPETIAASFMDLVQHGKVQRNYAQLFQSAFAAISQPNYGTMVDYTQPPTNRLPSLPLSAYAGIYRNHYFGEIVILARAGKLMLLQGPDKQAYALQHYNRDVFTYQPKGENAAGLSAVTFTVGATGAGTHVMIENLNTLQQGTFQRVSP